MESQIEEKANSYIDFYEQRNKELMQLTKSADPPTTPGDIEAQKKLNLIILLDTIHLQVLKNPLDIDLMEDCFKVIKAVGVFDRTLALRYNKTLLRIFDPDDGLIKLEV